jgi:C1A family cysteine protease
MSKNLRGLGGVLAGVIAVSNLALAADAAPNFVNELQVQQSIQSNKAKWSAHETWVSRLPQADVSRMLGLKHVPSNDAQFKAVEKYSPYKSQVTQSSIDWRNNNGVNWVSPILNQGNCGSCVAFSTVGTLETQVNITSGIPGLDPTFSAEALFMCGGASCDSGWEPKDAAKFLKSTGIPDEACMPYTSGATGTDMSCKDACADRASRSMKIVGYQTPSSMWGRDDAAVKAALLNGPLVTTLTVYADFLYYTGGVYKHVTGKAEGGHAVSIVGYDDNQQAWIIRNSWGADWGMNGFALVSYDDTSGVGGETFSFQVPQAAGYVSMENPIERTYLSGKVSFNASSTFANTSAVNFTVTSSSGQKITMAASGNSPKFATPYDTAQLADGQYDIVATAQYNGQSANSQHAIFYVLNHAPTTMSLKVTGTSVSLSKPLSDRVVFNLDAATGSTVPFSSITFHVAQNGPNGYKDIYTKEAELVVEQMTFGWRTGSVPDGTYDVYFTGDLSTAQGAHYSAESGHSTVQVSNGSGSSTSSPVVGTR